MVYIEILVLFIISWKSLYVMFYYSEAVDSCTGKENKKKFKRGTKQVPCNGTGMNMAILVLKVLTANSPHHNVRVKMVPKRIK